MRYLSIILFAAALFGQGKPNLPGGPVTQAADGSVAVSTTLLPLGWVDVRKFNAKGDGVTDDRVAFQAASDAAFAAGVGIYVPPGNYRIASFTDAAHAMVVLHSGVAVQGAGRLATRIYTDSASTAGTALLGIDATLPQYPAQTQYAITATAIGDLLVTLTMAGNTSHFAVGDYVYVTAGGSPISAESNIVTAIGTGTLSLEYPLSRPGAVNVANVTTGTSTGMRFSDFTAVSQCSTIAVTQSFGTLYQNLNLTTSHTASGSCSVFAAGNNRGLRIDNVTAYSAGTTAYEIGIFEAATGDVDHKVSNSSFSTAGASPVRISEGSADIDVGTSSITGAGSVNLQQGYYAVNFHDNDVNLTTSDQAAVNVGTGGAGGYGPLHILNNRITCGSSVANPYCLSLGGGPRQIVVGNHIQGLWPVVITGTASLAGSLLAANEITSTSVGTYPAIYLVSDYHNVTIANNVITGPVGNGVRAIEVADNGVQVQGPTILGNVGSLWTTGIKFTSAAHEVGSLVANNNIGTTPYDPATLVNIVQPVTAWNAPVYTFAGHPDTGWSFDGSNLNLDVANSRIWYIGNNDINLIKSIKFPTSCTGLTSGSAYNNGAAIVPCP